MAVAQLLDSRATPFPTTAVLYSVQLCRENAVNADWPILVYATKLQCATRHVTLAILSHDKVARQNHRCDIGLTFLVHRAGLVSVSWVKAAMPFPWESGDG